MFENKMDYWMLKKGLKNKQVAKLCDVSETTFSKWRQNKTQPDLKAAAIIARELNISVDQLIYGEVEYNERDNRNSFHIK